MALATRPTSDCPFFPEGLILPHPPLVISTNPPHLFTCYMTPLRPRHPAKFLPLLMCRIPACSLPQRSPSHWGLPAFFFILKRRFSLFERHLPSSSLFLLPFSQDVFLLVLQNFGTPVRHPWTSKAFIVLWWSAYVVSCFWVQTAALSEEQSPFVF